MKNIRMQKPVHVLIKSCSSITRFKNPTLFQSDIFKIKSGKRKGLLSIIEVSLFVISCHFILDLLYTQ